MLRERPPTTMTSAKSSCSVCGEPLQPHTEASCDNCGLPFHLNQRTDLPGKDCGDVWINEEHLGLEFGCNTCLHPEPQSAGALDDVLDSSEAANAAGVGEPELVAAAAGGLIRHRRTANGTYLFQRGDVLEFGRNRR